MAFHVVFTEDGIPGWIGSEARDGSEELPDLLQVDGIEVATTIEFLASHMRNRAGDWVPRPAPPAPSAAELEQRRRDELATVKANALQIIDDMIQSARLRFVTPLAGQEAIYLAKEAEAREYVAQVPEPEALDDYPYLAAEVGMTAPTALALAQVWLQRGALFRGLGARTENLRMTARKASASAPTVEDVQEAIEQLAVGLDGLG